MPSNPSTSWQKEGGNVEAVTDFIFLVFKITLGGDISDKIKSKLLLGRKTMTNLDSVLNNRDITLLIKVHIVKTMVFQQTCMDVRFGLQRKLSAEELVLSNYGAWRDLLRVPWTARRSNQSILKEINPEYSLEGLTLKLNLQYFDHLIQTANSLEKTLKLGRIGNRRRSGWQRMRR